MMGTPAILQTLKEASLLVEDEKNISSDDIVIAVQGKTEAHIQSALETMTAKLLNNELRSTAPGGAPVSAGEDGFLWREVPEDVRVALISVPGQYAAAEAWRALKSGLHVMLFSNNVSLKEEIALKKSGAERGLLVMGPDCGTAIINGVPLGFANRVRAGNIGIVAAAGSGLQELTCLIDRSGFGISHALGTGGRDLKTEVNGIMTKMGLSFLKDDPKTEVIIILSKPPDRKIADEILKIASQSGKPVVACLLGLDQGEAALPHVTFASTIEQAANTGVALLKDQKLLNPVPAFRQPNPAPKKTAAYLRGLFSGGTLAYEAYLLMQNALGDVFSNIPLDPEFGIGLEGFEEPKHIVLDLGTEQFTTGRPHPMIDGRWRADLISRIGKNKDIAVVLLDVILGLGANDDPAGLLVESIHSAGKAAVSDGRQLAFVASVVGTQQDPQNYSQQVDILRSAGVRIADTNAMAARMAIDLLHKDKSKS
jgi:FdrA protein